MGVFSWKTNDTKESIPATGNITERPTFTVTMLDNKGNKWVEKNYAGYGEFGGKDYYELLAEMNGLKTREEGIDLSFSGKAFISPNLNRNDWYEWVNIQPENCEHQGYFYNDEDEE